MKRVCLLILVLALGATAHGQTGKVVTAARVNGTYRYRDSEIRIFALGHHKLRIQLDLIYSYKSQYGLEANTGRAEGEAIIENDIAIFHPPDFAGCTITIKFLSGPRIKVTQNHDASDCGFGNHVTAGGTYRKTRAGKPRFEKKVSSSEFRVRSSGDTPWFTAIPKRLKTSIPNSKLET